MILKKISLIIICCVPLYLFGMEPQHQTAPAASSTSSITTAAASSITPQQQQKELEKLEQEHHNYLKQEVLNSKNNPHYKNYLMVLLSSLNGSEFNENIKHLNDDLTKHFATIYYLLMLFIKHGQYDYLAQFFDLVDQKLINFKINHRPQQQYSLIFSAYFYATENSKNPDVYFKIIDLLSNHGVRVTQKKMIYRSVSAGYITMIQRLIKIKKLKDGLSYFSKDSPEQELINAVKTLDLNLFKKTLRLCYSADIIDEQGKHILSHAVEIRTEKNKEIIDQIIILLFRYGHINLDYVVMWGDVRALIYVLQHPIKNFSSKELTALRDTIFNYVPHDKRQTMLNVVNNCLAKAEHDEAEAQKEVVETINQRPISEQWFEWAMQHYTDENVYQKIKNPHPTFSNEELDFWHAVAYSENDRAVKILQSNPGVRLTMPNRPYPGHNILTYCLTLQEGPNTALIRYLIAHHQDELYSLIKEFIGENKVHYINMLLQCGLNVNQVNNSFGKKSLLYLALFSAYKNKDASIISQLLQAGANFALLKEELVAFNEKKLIGGYFQEALKAARNNPVCLFLLQALREADFYLTDLRSALCEMPSENRVTSSSSSSTSSQTTQATLSLSSSLHENNQPHALAAPISLRSLVAQLSMVHVTSPKS